MSGGYDEGALSLSLYSTAGDVLWYLGEILDILEVVAVH